MTILCSASMRRSKNMPNDFSDVSRSSCLFTLFASKSSRRFLQFSSTRKRSLHLTQQIAVQQTQKKRLCPYVPVSSPSSTEEAIKWYNTLTSPSRSTWHRSDSRQLKNVFYTTTLSQNMHIPSLHRLALTSFTFSPQRPNRQRYDSSISPRPICRSSLGRSCPVQEHIIAH